MRNKKGAELTIGTIVIIILALIVLVVLIYGFTVGWGNLFENFRIFGGGKVNVERIVIGCKVSCTSSASLTYCGDEKNVIFNKDNPDGEPLTCFQLEDRNVELEKCTNFDCNTVKFEYYDESNECQRVSLLLSEDKTDKHHKSLEECEEAENS